MKQMLLSLLIFGGTFLLCHAEFHTYDLTCEQMENPVGVDVAVPRFSWKMHSTVRNAIQTAYQIMLADAPELLDEDKANVWNSGKVDSDCSLLIPFEGRQLLSSTTYYWKVRIWNGQGECSEWSRISSFTTGMMKEEDWNGAKWIAMEKDGEHIVPLLPFLNEEQHEKAKDARNYKMPIFRKQFSLPDKDIRQAVVYVCGLGHFDLLLNGEKVGDHFLDPGWTKYDKEALYVAFDVTNSLHKGDNVLGVMLGNGFYNVPDERYFKLAGSLELLK